MTFKISRRSKFVKRLISSVKSATVRVFMGGLALFVSLWGLGLTTFDHTFFGTFGHSTSKVTNQLRWKGDFSKLHDFTNLERQPLKDEKLFNTSGHTNDAPSTILAAGDIAKCNGEAPWKEEFLRLVKIRPDTGPSEPFLENLFELLALSEETDYPANAALTANLVLRLPGKVLALGDLVYPTGSIQQFQKCYESTWGQFKGRTYPVPGNHEYKQKNAQPYFDYWGNQAGQPGKGYYSFEAGEWHAIALNSKIEKSPPARTPSPQHAWLQHDLAGTNARCILAYWHHPVFSSGQHGGSRRMQNILQTLYDFGVTVVLTGHAHHYERFAPQNPEGVRDPVRGFRQFVVGTGGVPLRPIKKPHKNSAVYQADSFGVLRLDLYSNFYMWQFLSVKTDQPFDEGRGTCVSPTIKTKSIASTDLTASFIRGKM